MLEKITNWDASDPVPILEEYIGAELSIEDVPFVAP